MYILCLLEDLAFGWSLFKGSQPALESTEPRISHEFPEFHFSAFVHIRLFLQIPNAVYDKSLFAYLMKTRVATFNFAKLWKYQCKGGAANWTTHWIMVCLFIITDCTVSDTSKWSDIHFQRFNSSYWLSGNEEYWVLATLRYMRKFQEFIPLRRIFQFLLSFVIWFNLPETSLLI